MVDLIKREIESFYRQYYEHYVRASDKVAKLEPVSFIH